MKKIKFTKKAAALVVASVMLVGGVGAGTLAWLTAETDAVTNKFTKSDINVVLSETKGGSDRKFQMIPGWTIDKDPMVTVTKGSEDCYVFLEVDESNIENYIFYAIDKSWTEMNLSTLPTGKKVYYREVMDINNDVEFSVLCAGNETDGMGTANDTKDDVSISWGADQVAVKPSVTKTMMEAITEENWPTLTFKAYAVQLWKTNKPNRSEFAEGDAGTADYNAAVEAAQFTLEEAWNQIK